VFSKKGLSLYMWLKPFLLRGKEILLSFVEFSENNGLLRQGDMYILAPLTKKNYEWRKLFALSSVLCFVLSDLIGYWF
jgi:hypothetical protein